MKCRQWLSSDQIAFIGIGHDDMYHLIFSPNEPIWCFVTSQTSYPTEEVVKELIIGGLKKIGLQKIRSHAVNNGPWEHTRKIRLTPKQAEKLCSWIDGMWCPANIDRSRGIYACSWIELPKEYRDEK